MVIPFLILHLSRDSLREETTLSPEDGKYWQARIGGAALTPLGKYLPAPLKGIDLTPFTMVGTILPALFLINLSFCPIDVFTTETTENTEGKK